MIEEVTGNLLEANVEALVNTVNTVGVMGKGIALQFRQAFPKVYDNYRRAAKRGEIRPGEMFVVETGQLINPKYIINFPTKRHWKGKARIKDIENGLKALREVVKGKNISSIAVPPLGCGNGGLDWNEVRPKIKDALSKLPNVKIYLYAPRGAPDAETMRISTKRPPMTVGRAALLGLFKNYISPAYRLTPLEIQKLAYFLQCAGVPLKLEFKRHKYGPYSEVLQHVLQRIEGHFIRGYGDRSTGASIRLLPGAVDEATSYLREHRDKKFQERLARVSRLIEGFETPYGLELLTTVHWLAMEDLEARIDHHVAIRQFHAWSKHKREMFQPAHIKIAWERLKQQAWI